MQENQVNCLPMIVPKDIDKILSFLLSILMLFGWNFVSRQVLKNAGVNLFPEDDSKKYVSISEKVRRDGKFLNGQSENIEMDDF